MNDPIEFHPYTSPDTTQLPELTLQTLSGNVSAGVPAAFRWYVGDTWHVQKSGASNVGPQITQSADLSCHLTPRLTDDSRYNPYCAAQPNM
jgi:hypothetical protein